MSRRLANSSPPRRSPSSGPAGVARLAVALVAALAPALAMAQAANRHVVDLDGNGLRLSNRDDGGTLRAPADARFDSTRTTWRYALVDRSDWSLRVGLTANGRDSRPPISQTGILADRTNFGFVPALHLYGDRQLSERVRLVGDLDSQTAGPGRSLDLGLRLRYAFNSDVAVSAGLRVLDTGNDPRDQYSLGRFTSFTLGLGYRF